MSRVRTLLPLFVLLLVAGCIVQEDPNFAGAGGEGTGTGTGTGTESGTGTGTTDTTGTGTESGTGTGTESGTETGPEPVRHDMFVSSSVHTGMLGGRAGADGICATRASEAMLEGEWVALLSDVAQDARDAIVIEGPVYNMDGVMLATDAADLWDGAILDTFRLDETGNLVGQRGWTGTLFDGTGSGDHCNDWSAQTGGVQGTLGNANSTGSTWVDDGTWGCGLSFHLFCIRVG